MIVDQDLTKLLKKNNFFQNVDPTFIDSFIKPKNFFLAKEGTLLYTYSDESTTLYLIVEGEVKIKFATGKLVEFRYLLDFFGEKEILENSNRISAAIANKDSVLYSIQLDELNSLIDKYPVISENLKAMSVTHRDAEEPVSVK